MLNSRKNGTIIDIMNFKNNSTLIIGLSIPIIMILIIAGSIYMPCIFSQPKYSFIYTSSSDEYFGSYKYIVTEGYLTKVKAHRTPNTHNTDQTVQLFKYDAITNKSNIISFDKAKNFRLNTNKEALDGFYVVRGNNSNGIFPFIFWSYPDNSRVYLKNKLCSKNINLQLNAPYYNNFHFLGWIDKNDK